LPRRPWAEENSGMLSEEIYDRYKNERLAREKRALEDEKHPLFRNFKLVEKIDKPRTPTDHQPRKYFMERTEEYVNFLDISLLAKMHAETVYWKIIKEGKPIENLIVNDFSEKDIIFINYQDLDLLKNVTNQEMVNHTICANSKKIRVLTINFEHTGRYWSYNLENDDPVFCTLQEKDRIKFDDYKKISKTTGSPITIISTYSLEPIDKEINNTLPSEFNVNYN
jgi:hypothetical protein